MSAATHARLMACHECDALQHELPPGYNAACVCWRCGALLKQKQATRLDQALTLAISGLVLFFVANSFPLMVLNIQGASTTTTLISVAGALWSEGMEPIATLVFLTTVLVPVFTLLAMAYLAAGILLCEHGILARIPPCTGAVLYLVHWSRQWSMLEVFFLAAFVSIVRLSEIAQVRTGIALWACGALILVLAMLMASFHPRQLWGRVAPFRSTS